MNRALLLLLFPVASFAAPLSNDEASAYIEQLAASRPKDAATSVHFRETRTSPMLTKPATAEGELIFQPPARFRRETTGANGSLMVSDGRTLWIYYPAFKEAERYDLRSGAADAFRGLMSAFNLQDIDRIFRFSIETAQGVHRITLVPKRRSERRIFDELVLNVGDDQKLQKASWTAPDGEKTEMIFSGERRADSVDFEFKPTADVRVTTPLGR